jgi:hypothetical protein
MTLQEIVAVYSKLLSLSWLFVLVMHCKPFEMCQLRYEYIWRVTCTLEWPLTQRTPQTRLIMASVRLVVCTMICSTTNNPHHATDRLLDARRERLIRTEMVKAETQLAKVDLDHLIAKKYTLYNAPQLKKCRHIAATPIWLRMTMNVVYNNCLATYPNEE